MKYKALALSYLPFFFAFTTNAAADLVDFEKGFSDGEPIGTVVTATNQVTFEIGLGAPVGPAFIADVGGVVTGFEPNDGVGSEAGTVAGSFFLTDQNTPLDTPPRGRFDFFIRFAKPVSDLSLDLYDFRTDGGAVVGDVATLRAFSDVAMTKLVGSTSFTIPTTPLPDGNVVRLTIGGSSAFQAASLIFSSPSGSPFDGHDSGLGIDNIQFTTIVPVGSNVSGLQILLQYNGIPPSATRTTFAIEPLLCCLKKGDITSDKFIGSNTGLVSLGPITDSRNVPNLPPGSYTVDLKYAGSATGQLSQDDPGVVLANSGSFDVIEGDISQINFELSLFAGIVGGAILINGEAPGSAFEGGSQSEFSLCAEVFDGQAQTCFPLSASGVFSLLLPAGAGIADVCLTSKVIETESGSACPLLKEAKGGGSQKDVVLTFSFDVFAGSTVDLGDIGASVGALAVALRYNGAPPSTTGSTFAIESLLCCLQKSEITSDEFINTNTGLVSLGPITDRIKNLDLSPGSYTVDLKYAGSATGQLSQDDPGVVLASSGSIDVIEGEISQLEFDLTSLVGVVNGAILINEDAPGSAADGGSQSEFSVCVEVLDDRAQTCFTLSASGDFSYLLPAGAGIADVCLTSKVIETESGLACPLLKGTKGGESRKDVVLTFSFDVFAGSTVDLGEIGGTVSGVEVVLQYNDAPPSMTGASSAMKAFLCCMRKQEKKSDKSSNSALILVSLGPIVDTLRTLQLRQGVYRVDLKYAGSEPGRFSQDDPGVVLESSGSLDVIEGEISQLEFDLTSLVGVISGVILINGKAPGSAADGGNESEFSLCVEVLEGQAQTCFLLSADGVFSLLLPAGSGIANVCLTSNVAETESGSACLVDKATKGGEPPKDIVLTFPFEVFAGRTNIIRPSESP